MKQIAFLGPPLDSHGGVNIVIKELGNFFTNQGIEVHYFPIGKTNIKESEFIHPINTNSKKEQLKLFFEKFKYYNFHLTIANNLRTSYILSIYSQNVPINDLYVIHQGRILQDKIRWFYFKQRKKFRKIFTGKKIILFNRCSYDRFIKKFRIKADYFIIPNSFNLEEIKKKASLFPVKGKYILGVGRLEKEKNFEYLIKAYGAGNFKEELWLL
ncbi:MAG: hypothetical protein C6I01_00230, partial [Epsilonproteobacteria bacterium]|nr:hypothetical protein [Campylobacterota bacterium]NPA89211.1 glycosyltransferase [Campylobacterota bacterium]